MNIPEHTWMVFMLGGFSGLLYCGLIRPFLKYGIKRLKSRWHMYRSARLTDAEARGYGWAWGAVMVECDSLDSVEARIHPSISRDGVTQRAFDRGVSNAIDDIRYFLCLRDEREEAT